ncbi:mRNA capping enzyme catalytic domain-containing protein [Tetraselmis virus 1]|uniref:mRNA capping enzyme catalytic domain-containing protein n=1 Tax=Tetraselmis virus 1 TaxID=2060617 RepID=A0A2P0VN36_9VIRU|nr:mRNA capping enzyme catalytic domain-containing protein [Tetraselmis virus 1]AUF82311.1 mRNA capping enzyme catalytic domain-containing protein [Tetraselmis virus 1]
MPISFCSGIAHHITDDVIKEELLRDISDRMRVKTMMREAKVYREGSDQDTAGCYVGCLQSRGNPYLLFLTRIGFQETAMYVDRKVRTGHTLPRVIVDHIMFDQSLFDGTIITGEMVRSNDGEWRFLAEDMLAVRGKPISKMPFRLRYSALIEVVNKNYTCDESSTHGIIVKKFFPINTEGLEHMQEHYNEVPYKCTGYILRSLIPGKSSWFVKAFTNDYANKPSYVENSDTLKILNIRSTVSPDVYEAWEGNTDRGVVAVQSLEVSKELSLALGNSEKQIGWKCKWNPEFCKWVVMPGGKQ